jgi:hypothetical protein
MGLEETDGTNEVGLASIPPGTGRRRRGGDHQGLTIEICISL